MHIKGTVALVTGAARGLGNALVGELLARGAARVYATDLELVNHPSDQVVPLVLDITNPDDVTRGARLASDVRLLINNAGIATRTKVLTGEVENLRREFETNCLGTQSMMREFAPLIADGGGGTILNVLSAQSWFANPLFATYGVAKAGEWSLTNAARLELVATGVRVVGLHLGYMDTEMTADLDVPKSAPEDIARKAIDGIELDDYEIIADERSAAFRAKLSGPLIEMYPALAGS